MPVVTYNRLAEVGLIEDQPPESLPAGPDGFAWSKAVNVRFRDGNVQSMRGYAAIIAPSVVPYYYTRVEGPLASYYLYCGLQKIYVFYQSTHYNLTRQTTGVDVNYTGTALNTWQHCIINGIPVFNNGVDEPQAWTPLSTGQRLTPLPGWTSTERCKVMRSYRNFLVALNLTTAAGALTNRIRWSNLANPGALPADWNIVSTTSAAGEIELYDSDGYLVDCLQLGENNIVYKNTSIYVMTYVGGNDIFTFRKAFSDIGLLCRNCVVYFEGKHFAVTNDDVIVHDGFTYKSVIDGTNRRTLFANLGENAQTTSYCVHNKVKSEIWFCYPAGADQFPKQAFVYNYKAGVWNRRQLPESAWMTPSLVDIPAGETWAAAVGTWDTETQTWDQGDFTKNQQYLVLASPGRNSIDLIDNKVGTDGGAPIVCTLERESIPISVDQTLKTVRGAWLRTQPYGTALANAMNVYIGTQMAPNEPVNWMGPYSFDVLGDNKVDFFATGRYLSFRLETTNDIEWRLNSLSLDVQERGRW